MFSSLKQLILQKIPTIASLTGNKKWNLRFFEQMELGRYYVQVDLHEGIGVTVFHVLVFSIVNQHKHCASNE